MREMKDSRVPWIGKIPAGLKLIRNKYLLSYEKGKKADNTNLEYEGVPYIGASDLDSCDKATLYTTDTTLPEIICDDVLVLWDGARAGLVGTNKVGKLSSTVVKLIPDENVVSKKFLYWYYTAFQQYMYDMVNGTTIPHMNRKFIEDIGFLSWSLDEQSRMSNYLDTKCTQIDTIIAREQSVIEKLQEYNRAIISEAVTKGINSDREVIDSGVQWIGRIPNSWKIIKLKYEADIRRGRFSHRPRNDPDYYDGKYPFIQTGDITASKKYITSYTQTLNERGLKVSTSFPKDTICMSIAANIGDVAILSFDAYFPDSIVGIGSKKIEINYLYYALKNMKERLLSVATISTQQNINVEILNDEFIALPPVNEQKQISNYLDRKSEAIDRIVYQKKYLIDKLNEYKKSLIYEVVTGKKEVPHV